MGLRADHTDTGWLVWPTAVAGKVTTVPERSVIWNCPLAAPLLTACDSVAYCPEGQSCPGPQVATHAPGELSRNGTVVPDEDCNSMRVADTRRRRRHGESASVLMRQPGGRPTSVNCEWAVVGRYDSAADTALTPMMGSPVTAATCTPL